MYTVYISIYALYLIILSIDVFPTHFNQLKCPMTNGIPGKIDEFEYNECDAINTSIYGHRDNI